MIDLRPHNDPKRLMDEAKDWAATCRQQEAEIERLRAALKAAEDKQCASCRHCDSFGLRQALEGGAV